MAANFDDAEPWLTVALAVDRFEQLDYRLPPHVILPILRRLAKTRQLRTRGRCCDEVGRPYGGPVEIIDAEWAGVEFAPALLLLPHPGLVQDRAAGHRTVYAEVQLSGADLQRLWKAGAFSRAAPASTSSGGAPAGRPSDHTVKAAIEAEIAKVKELSGKQPSEGHLLQVVRRAHPGVRRQQVRDAIVNPLDPHRPKR